MKLAQQGAEVIGIDFSEEMIAIATAADPEAGFRVDSCPELSTVVDSDLDMIIANYVLMDTPDLDGAMRAFHWVLRPGGLAVLVFPHPCFPARRAAL